MHNRRSLREDVKSLTSHSSSRNYVNIPVYLICREGEGDGIGKESARGLRCSNGQRRYRLTALIDRILTS